MKALAFAGLVAAMALLVAGCGSSGNSSGGAAPQAGQGGPGQGGPPQVNQAAFERFQQCLEDHGVTLPSGRPQGQPGQRPSLDSKTQEAFNACRQYLPSPPQGGFGGQGSGGPST